MKYMVMECHPAYAVLMDEASRVVHAANLHYTVGQVVESPVLLQEQNGSRPHMSRTVKRFVAAAACFALMAGAGAVYYRSNYRSYSSIVVSAAAEVRMEISRTGKVLSVEPLNQDAAQLLADYDCKGKDQLTVTSELIERAVENGYVQKGDTVHVYYEKDKNKDPGQYQSNVESAITSHDLNADVRGEYETSAPAAQKPETAVHPETPAVPESIAEPVVPHGNAVPDTEHKEAPAPAVPESAAPLPEPKHTPAAPKADEPRPEAPAVKPAEPAAPAPAPKDPAPEAPAEHISVPRDEKPAAEPAPAAPQAPEPAAPEPVKPHEEPVPEKPAELPHEEPVKPHEPENKPAPKPDGHEPEAPVEPEAPHEQETSVELEALHEPEPPHILD